METELTDLEKAERIKEYRRKYREEHKEQIKEYNAKYKQEHKDNTLEYNKKYYETKKDAVKQKGLVKVMCECGKEVESWHLARHKKTKKCINTLNPPQKIETPPKIKKQKPEYEIIKINKTDNTISYKGDADFLFNFFKMVRQPNYPDEE